MSKYVGKKIRSLNCMGRNRSHYESIENFEDLDEHEDQLFDRRMKPSNNGQKKKKKHSGLIKSLPFVNKRNEKTSLLSGQKVKYSALVDQDMDGDESILKKNKKSVRFAENLYEEKNIPKSNATKSNRSKKNNKKEKSLLKRTGMLIVRSCRLMTYGAPYMPPAFPYNNRYPPDYRYYDFETGVYDYRNHYMSFGEYGAIYF